MDYKEQIKDPRWQKKRLEILQHDDFTCQMCGAKDKTLHVHHTIYIPGRNIWEYEKNQLVTLCEDCHSKEHGEYQEKLNEMILDMKFQGLTNLEILYMINFTLGQELKYDDLKINALEHFNPSKAKAIKTLLLRRININNKRFDLEE